MAAGLAPHGIPGPLLPAAPPAPAPPVVIPPPPADVLGVEAPKIPVPAWAYTLLAVLVLPVTVTWLLDGDLKTALATALTALGGKLVVDQKIARDTTAKVEATKQAAISTILEHRQVNLALGAAAGMAAAAELPPPPELVRGISESAVRREREKHRQRARHLRDLARSRG